MRDSRAARKARDGAATTVADGRAATLKVAGLARFVRRARRLAGLDDTSPFSVEDVHRVACMLGVTGLLFLEKADETRHATVLLGLDEARVAVYDPWCGVKVRPCDDTQLGMYCRPIGALGHELRRVERVETPAERPDVWEQYARRGARLRRFLGGRGWRADLQPAEVLHRIESVDLPPTQHESRPTDCAPLCLFVISKLGAARFRRADGRG